MNSPERSKSFHHKWTKNVRQVKLNKNSWFFSTTSKKLKFHFNQWHLTYTNLHVYQQLSYISSNYITWILTSEIGEYYIASIIHIIYNNITSNISRTECSQWIILSALLAQHCVLMVSTFCTLLTIKTTTHCFRLKQWYSGHTLELQ